MCSTPICIVYVLKCYTGVAWFFFHKRSKQSYLSFYRASLTFNLSVLAIALEVQLISFAFKDKFWNTMGYYQWFYASYYMCECIVIEIYMRHLDYVHFANNDLLKDRLIMKLYREA